MYSVSVFFVFCAFAVVYACMYVLRSIIELSNWRRYDDEDVCMCELMFLCLHSRMHALRFSGDSRQ